MNVLTAAFFGMLLVCGIVLAAEPANLQGIPVNVATTAGSGNEFGTDLYAGMRSEKSENLFFSPYSISSALAMTYAGAEERTKQQMAKVLHISLPDSDLHSANDALRMVLINTDVKTGFQLRVANRLWIQTSFHLLPGFLELTKASYGAEMGLVDFHQTEAARTAINSWIEDQTDRKIQNLLVPGSLVPETKLVLTNAIYFKARWKDEFNPKSTEDAPFYISASQSVVVPTMRRLHRFPYAAIDNAQILELPYGQDGSLSMLIVLPKTADGFEELEKKLSSKKLETWIGSLRSRTVEVRLPKFKMTAEFSLKPLLESMGMPLAFSDQANFSRISTQEPLKISAVIHKAFVDLNEEGTEAAAATAVLMMPTAAAPDREKPIEFRADHPFVFLIRHRKTQSILFMGRLMNPKS